MAGKNLLRLGAVLNKTGKTITNLYKAMKDGSFPKPVATGPRTRAWVEEEVDAWIEQQIERRDRGLVPVNPGGSGRGKRLSADSRAPVNAGDSSAGVEREAALVEIAKPHAGVDA
jgi:prophage regulatory protein